MVIRVTTAGMSGFLESMVNSLIIMYSFYCSTQRPRSDILSLWSVWSVCDYGAESQTMGHLGLAQT